MALSDAQLQQFLRLSFEEVCNTPVEAFIDAEGFLDLVTTLSEPARVQRWHGRLWSPLRTRLLTRASTSEVKLGAWLPPTVTAWLREQAPHPVRVPRKWVEEAVGSEKVREATKQTLIDALTSFVQKATTVVSERAPGGGGGGLFGAIRSSAKAATSVIGGLTEGFQQQLLERVKDQADGLVALVQQRVVDRVSSEETAKNIGRRRAAILEKLLDTTEKKAVANAMRVPWADLDQGLPLVVAHNLQRDALRAVIREEFAAVLDALKGETLGSLLTDAGLRDTIEARWVSVGMPVARALDARGLLTATETASEAS